MSAHRSRAPHLALCTHIVARMQRHRCAPTVTSFTSCCRQGRYRGGAQRRRERQGVHHCAVHGPVHFRAVFEDCWNLKGGFALLHLSEEELGTPTGLCAAASCQKPEPLRPLAQGGGAHGRLLGLGHARPAAGGAWAVKFVPMATKARQHSQYGAGHCCRRWWSARRATRGRTCATCCRRRARVRCGMRREQPAPHSPTSSRRTCAPWCCATSRCSNRKPS